MSATYRALSSSRHLPTLDGLRGVAIALVLMHSLSLLSSVDSMPGRIIHSFFASGWVGVQLFFVLSGFLITGILLDARSSPHFFRNFYVRRALRIFPLYYATLIIAFIALPAIGHMPEVYRGDVAHQARFWLYLTNWFTDTGLGFSHYWSLALEEQFYILWPLIVFYCETKKILKICLSVSIAGLVIRFWMRTHGFAEESVYIATPCRMDALTTGSAVAILMRIPQVLDWLRPRIPMITLTTFTTGFLFFALTGGYGSSLRAQVFGFGALTVFFAQLVMLAALLDHEQLTPRWSMVLRSKPLLTLGKYSYGMYVFQRQIHIFIGMPFIKAYASNSIAINILYVMFASLLTLAIAIISYQYFELPFLRLKKNFAG